MLTEKMLDEWLVGRHVLVAVFPKAAHPFKKDGEAFGIKLDTNYVLFVEDQNDDYRSEMGNVFVATPGGYWSSEREATRINRDVLVDVVEKSECYGVCKLYEFKDAETGIVGLRVGTSNIDDYYPSFTVEYNAAAWNAA